MSLIRSAGLDGGLYDPITHLHQNQPDRHLIIVGLTASGKSTLAQLLRVRSGLPVIEVGGIVISDFNRCRFCTNPLEHADHAFKSGNFVRFVERAVRLAQDYGAPSIIVGPRHPIEVQFLMKSLRVPLIIGLDVPASIRSRRYIMPSNVSSLAKKHIRFFKRDTLERSWGADYSLLMSHFLLDAVRPVSELVEFALTAWLQAPRCVDPVVNLSRLVELDRPYPKSPMIDIPAELINIRGSQLVLGGGNLIVHSAESRAGSTLEGGYSSVGDRRPESQLEVTRLAPRDHTRRTI